MLQLRNDKYNFIEWSVEEREEALAKVEADVGGAETAQEIFEEELSSYSLECVEDYDWDDVDAVDDGLYDNAGCSVYQALVDLAALTYVNGDGLSWREACDDVLEQVS